MSQAAISVERLGKSYIIGHETRRERYTALRDVLAGGTKRLLASAWHRVTSGATESGLTTEEFWALRDVAFEIGHGEVVGVIGRNGAGKSTLLKILSRITEPTQGRVTIDGRVASLLEVGTGFHPELTGRENIFLNGAILGMNRSEIRRKFDEIVDFAEVERFLDTPVKRYSSGMYVRLAFAVAAHLEPDILVVDEVLAVGDAEFQKKCLGKMKTVAGGGRTVLFVSHNMAAIQSLCKRSLYLRGGQLIFDGDTASALEHYIGHSETETFTRANLDKDIYLAALDGVSLHVERDIGRRKLCLDLVIRSRLRFNVNVDVRISDNWGMPIVFATLGDDRLESPVPLVEGDNRVRLAMDVTPLLVGNYKIGIDISTPFVDWHDRVDNVATFVVDDHHRSEVIQPARQDSGRGSIQFSLEYLPAKSVISN